MHKTNRSMLWVAAIFIFAALILVFFFLGINKVIHIEPHDLGIQFDLLCIFLTITIVIVLVLYYLQRKRFDFFEFPVWFTLNIYIQVIINVWLLQRDYQFSSPWITNSGEVAIRTIILIWGSLAIIWTTYFLGIRHHKPNAPTKKINNSKPRLKLMVFVWFLTWSINFIYTINGSQGFLSGQNNFTGGNYLYFVNLINYLVTFNLMINYFRSPTNWGRLWIIFVCTSTIFISLILGTKSGIFIFLYLAICYFYVHGRLPIKWLAIGVSVLLFVVPVVTTFRLNLYGKGFSQSAGASFSERIPILQKTINDVLSNPSVDVIGQTKENFEARQSGIFQVTAGFLAVHPKYVPFVFVDYVELIATSTIPRFIWPDKPTTRPQLYNILTNYFGAKQETSFAAVGQIADAYRIGGPVFLFLWFIFITWFMLKLYIAGPGRKSVSGTGFYVLFLTQIITYDNSLNLIMIRLLQFGIILYFLNNYVFFNQKKLTNT